MIRNFVKVKNLLLECENIDTFYKSVNDKVVEDDIIVYNNELHNKNLNKKNIVANWLTLRVLVVKLLA